MLAKDDLTFPSPDSADAAGLLAIGGDLLPARLLEAYRQGIFPWYEPGYPILWWSPDPRLILKPLSFRLSRSLRQALKKTFHYSIDAAFSSVIQACATSGGRLHKTWITDEMIQAYVTLHEQGYAHSFEVWQKDKLVGGLYGLSLGRAFFGESMFHEVRDASKLALYMLCQTCISLQFEFIDCQLPTAHLISLGAETMPRKKFLQLLKDALQYPTLQGSWSHLMK